MQAQIAMAIPCTEAEGPGKRYALWFQGCPLRCPGCCNPEYLSFRGGVTRTLDELCNEITTSHRDNSIEGISLLGGEPFAQAEVAGAIARSSRALGLSVMVYTGFTLQELQSRNDAAIQNLLAATDVLVDGPYDRDRPDTRRRWVGSTNQIIHFLTPRHHDNEDCWKQSNTLEIRLTRNEITLNGFPSLQAVELWKPKWKRSRP